MSEEFQNEPPPEEIERSMDMDAITAHLDRGWGLLGKGDVAGARVSAHHILQLDEDSPEGHTLLGAIAAADGDAQDAMDLFMRALDSDPDYVDAILYAAELAIHPLGDAALAKRLCDDAEELLSDEDPERLDVWLLRAEACLGTEGEGASASLDDIPQPPYPDPIYYLRVGRICLDLDRAATALPLLKEALKHERTEADAHYFLGIAEDMGGHRDVALAHLLEVHRLDGAHGEIARALSEASFGCCVEEAMARLAAPFAGQIAALPVRIQKAPPVELVAEGFDPRAPIFLAGLPPEPRSDEDRRMPGGTGGRRRRGGGPTKISEVMGAVGIPSCLFIYKDNLERFVGNGNAEDITEELFHSLAEEVAFFFGLDDTEASRLIDGSGSVVEH